MCDNKSIEELHVFNYLGCLVSFDVNYDLEKNINIPKYLWHNYWPLIKTHRDMLLIFL